MFHKIGFYQHELRFSQRTCICCSFLGEPQWKVPVHMRTSVRFSGNSTLISWKYYLRIDFLGTPIFIQLPPVLGLPERRRRHRAAGGHQEHARQGCGCAILRWLLLWNILIIIGGTEMDSNQNDYPIPNLGKHALFPHSRVLWNAVMVLLHWKGML